jgi:hypothetical protein
VAPPPLQTGPRGKLQKIRAERNAKIEEKKAIREQMGSMKRVDLVRLPLPRASPGCSLPACLPARLLAPLLLPLPRDVVCQQQPALAASAQVRLSDGCMMADGWWSVANGLAGWLVGG